MADTWSGWLQKAADATLQKPKLTPSGIKTLLL
jgi:hypothetical protein